MARNISYLLLCLFEFMTIVFSIKVTVTSPEFPKVEEKALDINPQDSVLSLAGAIAKCPVFGNIPTERQMLFCDQIELPFKDLLSEHNIKDGDRIILRKAIELGADVLTSDYVDGYVDCSLFQTETIGHIKEVALKTIGIPNNNYCVTFRGRELEDNKTFLTYGIDHDDEITISSKCSFTLFMAEKQDLVDMKDLDLLFSCPLAFTIRELKEHIIKKYFRKGKPGHMPINDFNLRLNEQWLSEEKNRLWDYKPDAGARLIVVLN